MSRRLTPALVAGIATALCASPAASADAGRHIVVLQDGADAAAVAADHGRAHGARVAHVFRHALRGYAATIPEARLDRVRADRRVAYVAEDGIASAAAQTLPWGVDRVDADLGRQLAGDGTGAVTGVHVYVVDSGVARHPDIDLVRHVNVLGGKNTDCHGHGTHVAGTLAARDDESGVVGVAPGAPVTAVKVLDCKAYGPWSAIIAGIDWVTANARRPAVANLSITGAANRAVDDAVRRSVAAGITYAVAAGNEGADACTRSPARAGTTPGVLTVAATDPYEREAPFSNYGPCVDLWAPGVSILSTAMSGGTRLSSGTSMAAPHVAGGAAAMLAGPAGAGLTPAAVEAALTGSATPTGTQSKDGRAVLRENAAGL